MEQQDIYVYAFDYLSRVVDYKFLKHDVATVNNMKRLADWMQRKNPDAHSIWAVDNRTGLRRDFRESILSHSEAEHVIFKDLFVRDGICLYERK